MYTLLYNKYIRPSPMLLPKKKEGMLHRTRFIRIFDLRNISMVQFVAHMIQNDEYYMRKALYEAQQAWQAEEVPVGAVIVCRGDIIGRGFNLVETLRDATAHAEMQAITSASQALGGKYLHDCTLYVTVEPCPMCAAALGWSQIGRIVYGTGDAKRGYRLLAPGVLHPRTKVTSGILEEECRQLMKDFFRKRR